MASTVLPEPAPMRSAPFCLRCGYSLAGLGPPGDCPECGLLFEDGQLVLCGIARHAPRQMPLLRRMVWFALIAMLSVFAVTWTLLAVRFFLVFGALSLAIMGCVAWLVSTSQRERQAFERFAITREGIVRLPFTMVEGATNIDAVFIPFGEADWFEVRRTGAKWKRLMVGTKDGAVRVRDAVFDAGFRCSDEYSELVRGTMARVLAEHVLRKGAPPPA